MEKCFLIGLALGMIGGALLAVNSKKTRSLVKQGQEEIMEKVDELDKVLKEKFSKKKSSEEGNFSADVSED